MWVFLNDSFLSIVSKDCRPTELLVRARRPGDIKRVFGERTKVAVYKGADYHYRAVIPRSKVVAALTAAVGDINYPNFKDSVRDDALHSAYLRVWQDMAAMQPDPPYSGKGKRT